MSASFTLNLLAKLSGLGEQINYFKTGTDETTPTAGSYMYRKVAVADTAEALDLGDVSTVTAIVLYAIDYDLDIDTSYVSSFVTEQTAKAAGLPVVITYPGGTVYVKGETGQTTKYEYVVIGQT